MMSVRTWFKHAFAVDPAGAAEPTVEQQAAVDWVCVQIAKRHLTTPGLIFLEMSRPLNYLGSQVMHFFRPGVWALAADPTYEGYKHFSIYLEQRGSMEYLADRVEHFEQEFTRVEKSGGSVRDFIHEHFQTLRTQREHTLQQDSAATGMRCDDENA